MASRRLLHMTPIKETLESGSSSADTELSQGKARPRPESPHLRADAVSLELPVKVHGSLISNAVAGAAPQAQPFEEQTTTMIVFPQGGVLKMSTPVSAGQVMVLTSLKSRQDSICRVLKVRAYAKAQSYVEVEFTSPQPGYWGVYFPSDGPAVSRTAPPEPPVVSKVPAEAPPAPPANSAENKVQEVSWAPASSPRAPAAMQPELAVRAESPQPAAVPPPPPPKLKPPLSSFVSIGSKEDVELAASSTGTRRTSSLAESSAKRLGGADTDISDAIDALIAPSIPAARAPSSAEPAKSTRTAAPAAADAARERPASAFGSQMSAAESAPPAPKQMFGVMLDSALPADGKASQGNGSKIWIPIAIAALLAVAAGGAYYFRSRSAASAAALTPAASAVPAPTAQPAVVQNPVAPSPVASVGAGQQIPDQAATALQRPEVAPASGASSDFKAEEKLRAPEHAAKAHESEPLAPRHEASASIRASQSAAPAPSHPIVAIPSAFGALNTRPVVSHHANAISVGAAPALEPGGSPAMANGSLSSIAAPPPNLPAPSPPAPTGPIRVGGNILPPKLVSSVLPVYPPIAQQAGVTGAVVVDTTIGKDGRIAKMKVISGPELLRQSALNALRQWKYEPSKLNGQPISVEMVISIQFH
jgi:TonB family protein